MKRDMDKPELLDSADTPEEANSLQSFYADLLVRKKKQQEFGISQKKIPGTNSIGIYLESY